MQALGLAQIALAWLLAQKPWIVPIPGTRNLDHLNENLAAINVQLTAEDLRELETAFSKIKVHGGRMNEWRCRSLTIQCDDWFGGVMDNATTT